MSKLVLIPPPAHAAALLGFCFFLSRRIPSPMDLSMPLAGGGALIGAIVLALWAMFTFRRSRTTPMPTGTPSALVTTGPYQWTRNPMYLGILLAMIAVPLLDGSLWYLFAPPAFWIVVNTVFIPYEEAKLTSLFGAEYQAFSAKVPRWMPCGRSELN